jgi:hypothetical protein
MHSFADPEDQWNALDVGPKNERSSFGMKRAVISVAPAPTMESIHFLGVCTAQA